LKARLEREHLGARRTWIAPTIAAFAGALVAAAIVMLVVRPAPPGPDIAMEAAGDHLRVLAKPARDVVTSDMHTVKPWFAGKLDFVPPISFLGDEEFPLRGGDLAVFLGHRAAAFVYARHLHVISLFVFEGGAATEERTVQGFHVLAWSRDGFGCALVSDVNWDDLRALRSRL
jgi:anti-sigma factor RsiW